MNTKLLSSLQDYGMNDKEARVYLTTLELGAAPVSTIARRAEVKRITTYYILLDLEKKGIANQVIKNGVKCFSVIGANRLLTILEDRFQHFKEMVPEFIAIDGKAFNSPKVKFFE